MQALSDIEYWTELGTYRAEKTESGNIVVSDNTFKKSAVLRELLRHSFYKKMVFEIGSGLANIGKAISSLYMGSFYYEGCDISESFRTFCNDHLKVKVHNARSTKLPVKDEQVDFVWAFDVLEHIHPNEREQTYREIARILKPGGLMIINSPMIETNHTQYDYGFNDRDVKKFEEITGLKRVYRKVISYHELQDDMRIYMYEELQKCV